MNSSSTFQYKDYFKIVFLGSRRVGKTSIIRRIFDQEPLEEYLPTLGVKFHNLEIISEKKHYLQFWDISGNELYSYLTPSYMKNATIVILIFDYKNIDSQSIIESLYNRVCEFISPDRVLITGNKFEKEKSDIPKILHSWLKKHDLTVLPISALENKGIAILLQNIVRFINGISENQGKNDS